VSRRAVFLDRDGTINREVLFLGDAALVVLEKAAPGGLRLLQGAGFDLIVVSNQSGVARGFFDEDAVRRVNATLSGMLRAEGVELSRFYFCPHHAEGAVPKYAIGCDCRKPAPGLLLSAARDADIDLKGSYCVGDSARDVEAGRAAGTRTVLVLTGFGAASLAEVESRSLADYVAEDLAAAARWIIKDCSGSGGDIVDS